jgi:hypothetical protein
MKLGLIKIGFFAERTLSTSEPINSRALTVVSTAFIPLTMATTLIISTTFKKASSF